MADQKTDTERLEYYENLAEIQATLLKQTNGKLTAARSELARIKGAGLPESVQGIESRHTTDEILPVSSAKIRCDEQLRWAHFDRATLLDALRVMTAERDQQAKVIADKEAALGLACARLNEVTAERDTEKAYRVCLSAGGQELTQDWNRISVERDQARAERDILRAENERLKQHTTCAGCGVDKPTSWRGPNGYVCVSCLAARATAAERRAQTLEIIVRRMSECDPEQSRESDYCQLCDTFMLTTQHATDCPYRMAKEWVERTHGHLVGGGE